MELSWAWHDRQTGERGHESVVILSVLDDGSGSTILTMQQTGLPDSESARLHREGWTSSLDRLDELIAPAGPVP